VVLVVLPHQICTFIMYCQQQEIKKYEFGGPFNGITFIPSLLNISQVNQKLKGGKHTYRQTDNMVISQAYFLAYFTLLRIYRTASMKIISLILFANVAEQYSSKPLICVAAQKTAILFCLSNC
jgi:hypothetical protein